MMKKNCQGFTLIELVVVIIIFGIIAAMGGVMLRQGFVQWQKKEATLEADWQGMVAIQRMVRELHLVAKQTTYPSDQL